MGCQTPEHVGPPADPLMVAARRAALRILVGEPLDERDRDALRQVVFVEDMEALPNEF